MKTIEELIRESANNLHILSLYSVFGIETQRQLIDATNLLDRMVKQLDTVDAIEVR